MRHCTCDDKWPKKGLVYLKVCSFAIIGVPIVFMHVTKAGENKVSKIVSENL